MEVDQKIKNRVIIWSINHTPGHWSRKNEKSNSKRYTHTQCSYVHNSTICKKQQCKYFQMHVYRKCGVCMCVYICIYTHTYIHTGFPSSSVGKESAYNSGDPGSIPGSGRSTGEGIGYPLQYSWPSLLAQLVKNLPAMREIWIWTLGWEDPLEKGTATHSSILAWKIPWTLYSP